MGLFRTIRFTPALAVAAVFVCAHAGATGGEAAPNAGYHISGNIPLSGAGGGDYVSLDSEARRLYVTHGDQVHVLDADSLKPVGIIRGTPHCHGVLPLGPVGKGYVTSGQPGSVMVFDLKTLKLVGDIGSSPDSDGILYDPFSARVVSFNGDSHNATVIDPGTDKVVKVLDLGGSPEAGVSDGKGKLFANLKDKGEVLRIDSASMTARERWPVAPGKEPCGLAMDAEHHRLFIGCRNKLLVVMDSTNGKIIQTLPIGDKIDTTVFDPQTGNILESCGDGTLSVVHEDGPDRYKVVENASTQLGAKTMAFDPRTGRIFSSTAKSGPFHVLVVKL
jgi:DNA-binding beta-propeller fold protein YncE